VVSRAGGREQKVARELNPAKPPRNTSDRCNTHLQQQREVSVYQLNYAWPVDGTYVERKGGLNISIQPLSQSLAKDLYQGPINSNFLENIVPQVNR
jgi:hypothetical protein